MDINQISQFLLYSTLLNYGLLLIWFLMISCAKDIVKRIHGCWFQLSDERFDAIHYQMMGNYKLLIFVFNLSPLLVLKFFLS